MSGGGGKGGMYRRVVIKTSTHVPMYPPNPPRFVGKNLAVWENEKHSPGGGGGVGYYIDIVVV
jgi:hypothetical protein